MRQVQCCFASSPNTPLFLQFVSKRYVIYLNLCGRRVFSATVSERRFLLPVLTKTFKPALQDANLHLPRCGDDVTVTDDEGTFWEAESIQRFCLAIETWAERRQAASVAAYALSYPRWSRSWRLSMTGESTDFKHRHGANLKTFNGTR